MSEINKTFRIRTDIGEKLSSDYITLDANLVQDYDTFDILSVKINSVDTYKLHNANYGVVVGRVLANNGFGIPNAKLSIFIAADSDDGEKLRELYPFSSTVAKDRKGVRYNLLPNEKVKFTGTYLGPYYNIYNFDGASGVIQVGSEYVIVSTDKLKGLEGQTVTVKGYFINDVVEAETVPIDNKYVNGESFCIEEVV